VSERRVRGALSFRRSTCRYQSVADEQAALKIRLRDLAQARVIYGYRRLHILLQKERWQVNHKRVYRLYHQEGLEVRPKKPQRHVTACRHMERAVAAEPNEGWSMEFMGDELFDGRRIRLLTIVDSYSRESLAIEVDQRIGGGRVMEVLMQLGKERRLPRRRLLYEAALSLSIYGRSSTGYSVGSDWAYPSTSITFSTLQPLTICERLPRGHRRLSLRSRIAGSQFKERLWRDLWHLETHIGMTGSHVTGVAPVNCPTVCGIECCLVLPFNGCG